MALPSPAFYPDTPHTPITVELGTWTNGIETGIPTLTFTPDILQYLINKASQQEEWTLTLKTGEPPVQVYFKPS